MANLDDLEQRARQELAASAGEAALRAWHTKYFGKQGELPAALKAVGTVPQAERKAYGQKANAVKDALTQAYEHALAAEKERALASLCKRIEIVGLYANAQHLNTDPSNLLKMAQGVRRPTAEIVHQLLGGIDAPEA